MDENENKLNPNREDYLKMELDRLLDIAKKGDLSKDGKKYGIYVLQELYYISENKKKNG